MSRTVGPVAQLEEHAPSKRVVVGSSPAGAIGTSGRRMHHTKTKGDIGVAFVIARLTELGWTVGVPITEHAPYDLFAERDGKVHTVQVRYVTARQDKICVRLRTIWNDRHGCHARKRVPGRFSALAVYCPEHGVFFISDSQLGDNGYEVALRVSAARNHQQKGVRMAHDFRDLTS